MKSILLFGGKHIIIMGLGLLLGLLLVTGLGAKKGTRLYRLRMGLWSLLLGLAAAGGLFAASTLSSACTCYKPMPDPKEPDPALEQTEQGGETSAGEEQDEGMSESQTADSE